jgi:hypothetical protein
VDGRDKPGHDEEMDHLPTYLENLDTFPAILSTSGPSAFL